MGELDNASSPGQERSARGGGGEANQANPGLDGVVGADTEVPEEELAASVREIRAAGDCARGRKACKPYDRVPGLPAGHPEAHLRHRQKVEEDWGATGEPERGAVLVLSANQGTV